MGLCKYKKDGMTMENYVLSCCSTVDLSEEHLAKRNIHYLCFHFTLGDKEYPDDLGKSVPFNKFYKAMSDGLPTKTSQVNVVEYVDYFTKFLEKGLDIVHVTLSSGLSGTYNSASLAREMLLEQFPDRHIYIIDSLGASSGSGLFMEYLADLRDSGMSAEDLYGWALDHRLNLNHWFFSTDLTYYVRGGRISKAAGWFGTALKICPLLNMNDEGKLIPRYKLRGKRAVIKRIVEKMVECADGGREYNGKCFISHSDCLEDALAVKNLVLETFPNLNGDVLINSIGTTIGSHTGPGTVALFFMGAKRER